MTRIDADQIRVELGVERVVDAYGLRGVHRNGWLRLRECPRCHEKSSREAIAIEMSSGRWLHHGRERAAGGDCSGDLFDLVAACEGLDTRKDFSKVLALAASLAGFTATDPDFERRVEERMRQRAAQEQRDHLMRQRAARDSAEYWDALADRHDHGELYLTRRGLDPYAVPVRYTPDGDPSVALYASDGRVTSVATRHREPGDRPKVVVRRGTTTKGTMVNSLQDIRYASDVILVEGVMDALTARLAWPKGTILGANGAGNLAQIAKQAISRVKLARTRLFLVPHDDEPGIRAMTAAGTIALAAGFHVGCQLRVVDLRESDLNAAWCAGWRPQGADRCQ